MIIEQTTTILAGEEERQEKVHSEYSEKQIHFLGNVLSLMTRTPRVLIVDDDDNDIELLTAALGGFLVEITAVSNSEEGMRMLLDRAFDVAFVDYRMPVMDGYELIKRVIFDSRGTNFFLVTAYPESQVVSGAIKAGAVMVLSKPVSSEVLARIFQLKPSELPPEQRHYG
jgi:CheY-like chemotaxis protein